VLQGKDCTSIITLAQMPESSYGSASKCSVRIKCKLVHIARAGAGSTSFRFAVKDLHLRLADGAPDSDSCSASSVLMHIAALTVVWLDTPAAEHGMCALPRVCPPS